MRRLQPVGKSGGDAYLLITISVIILPPPCSFHSINSTPGDGPTEEKTRAGMTLFPPQPLFHCLDAQILTGFSRPLLCGNRRDPEHREHRKFRHSIKNTPLAGACGAGIAQALENLRHLTLTPKPRVLGSSPSTPGCEIPRKPFKHWLPGVFPCAQNLCLSVMFFAVFGLFSRLLHRNHSAVFGRRW